MNFLAHVRGFLLAAMATTLALASEPLLSLRSKGPEARLKLVEIVQLAGKTYAAIADEYGDRIQGQWWSVGGYVAGCHVKEIGRDAVWLIERQTGREITLPLVGIGGSETEDAAQHRKAWINSSENPMYFRPFRLPAAVTGRWTGLSEEDKSQVATVYRDYGWTLVVTELAGASPHFGWKSIYVDERNAAGVQARIDFENSLNPEQRAIYAKIKATLDDPPSGSKTREQLRADDQVRLTEWPKLRATLSPSQQALHEAMSDPRKAMKRMK